MITSGPTFKAPEERLRWRETASAVAWSRPSRGITGDLGPSLMRKLDTEEKFVLA